MKEKPRLLFMLIFENKYKNGQIFKMDLRDWFETC